MKPKELMLVLIILFTGVTGMKAQNGSPEVQRDSVYWEVVSKRAGKIVKALNLEDPSKFEQVCDLIAQQYYDLNGIHDRCKAEKEKLKEKAGCREEIEDEMNALQANADSQLAVLHRKYIVNLSDELSPEQIEDVKNGMTYGVLPITYAGYLDMIPDLTEEEKQQIMIWLNEAREHAMDAGSSEEKHGWFGKYKGRINNYLSSHGYDLKKYSEAREARIRESQKN